MRGVWHPLWLHSTPGYMILSKLLRSSSDSVTHILWDHTQASSPQCTSLSSLLTRKFNGMAQSQSGFCCCGLWITTSQTGAFIKNSFISLTMLQTRHTRLSSNMGLLLDCDVCLVSGNMEGPLGSYKEWTSRGPHMFRRTNPLFQGHKSLYKGCRALVAQAPLLHPIPLHWKLNSKMNIEKTDHTKSQQI